MTTVTTKYGVFTDVTSLGMHYDGTPESFNIHSPYEIKTQAGVLSPLYSVEDMGRRKMAPLYLYENGTVKNISLQGQSLVDTSLGALPAEKLTFYENGAVKRVFPLNGRLSGFWTEKNETKLAEEIDLQTPVGIVPVKPISILFYDSCELRSITFWPEEVVRLNTPLGKCNARVGVSFYKSGAMRSFEPAKPTMLETPIGFVEAFDPDPEGIYGDINSVQFHEDGRLKSVLTANTQISVIDKSGNGQNYAPTKRRGYCSDLVLETVPMLIEFDNDKVRFNNSKRDEFSYSYFMFKASVFGFVTRAVEYAC